MIKLLSLLLLLLPAAARMAASELSPPPNCKGRCGDVEVFFPFGIKGDAPECYLDGFDLLCNSTADSKDKLYAGADFNIEVVKIDHRNAQATMCKTIGWNCTSHDGSPAARPLDINLTNTPFVLSSARNKFTVVGCNTMALFAESHPDKPSAGCISLCEEDTNFKTGTCLGAGCCQAAIPSGLQYFSTSFFPISRSLSSDTSQCSYAFPIQEDLYKFNKSHLESRKNFVFDNKGDLVPIIVDWSIGRVRCEKAKNNKTTYACISENSRCLDASNGPGYICNCSAGYRGNPYMEDGCQDIDECKENDPCTGGGFKCVNKPGSYVCEADRSNTVVIITSIAVGGGSILLLVGIAVLWRFCKKRSIQKKKQRFYQQNLELLTKEQSFNYSDVAQVERMKIYDLDELEKATNYFDKSRIVGGGGHGYVYKGILSDQRVVAIKKPKITNQNELGQFINEVFLLSQTSHKNIVKFFGCCLETEVPLLVFEFISGGTLSSHLIGAGENFSPLSFEDRLRISTEIASSLSYLHTAAAITIFHRDIKSANVLLDEKNIAKLADFGASRSVALEQTSIFTVVQGTYGYLDPEYHQTGKLTDKSDVYSFGVILVELLCGRTATPYRTQDAVRTVVMDLLDAMKDDSLYKILDPLVLKEGKKETIERVARLAKSCLRLSGKERPTMKEVENELEALRSRKQRSGGGGGDDDDDDDDKAKVSMGNLEKQVVFDDASGLFMNSFGSTTASFGETGSISSMGQYFSSEEMGRQIYGVYR